MTVQDVRPGKLNILSLSGDGVTPWVALRTRYNPFEVTLVVDTDADGVDNLTAKVQYVVSEDPDTALAHEIVDHPALTGITDHGDDKLNWAVSHVRMVVTGHSAGVANFKVLQPGAA